MRTQTMLIAVFAGSLGFALAGCSAKSAQERGAELAAAKIDVVTGVGDALQQKGELAGESLASGVGTVVKGMQRGALKEGRSVAADASLARAGLSVTKVQDVAGAEGGSGHALDAYLVATAPAVGTVRMVAFDLLGNEIGRATSAVDLAADSARYYRFALAEQVDLQSVRGVSLTYTPGTGQTAH